MIANAKTMISAITIGCLQSGMSMDLPFGAPPSGVPIFKKPLIGRPATSPVDRLSQDSDSAPLPPGFQPLGADGPSSSQSPKSTSSEDMRARCFSIPEAPDHSMAPPPTTVPDPAMLKEWKRLDVPVYGTLKFSEEAEKKRLEAEEAERKRLEAKEAERKRLAEEARKLAEEAERKRLAEEAERKRLAELELKEAERKTEQKRLNEKRKKKGVKDFKNLNIFFKQKGGIPKTPKPKERTQDAAKLERERLAEEAMKAHDLLKQTKTKNKPVPDSEKQTAKKIRKDAAKKREDARKKRAAERLAEKQKEDQKRIQAQKELQATQQRFKRNKDGKKTGPVRKRKKFISAEFEALLKKLNDRLIFEKSYKAKKKIVDGLDMKLHVNLKLALEIGNASPIRDAIRFGDSADWVKLLKERVEVLMNTEI